MGSWFDDVFEKSVNPVFQTLFGVDVKLSRAHLTTATFTARRGNHEYQAMGQEYGVEVRVTMRDYLLPVSSVVIDGDKIEPRKGDRITEGDEVFEAHPPDNNTPVAELQPGGYDWLVHTKRIE